MWRSWPCWLLRNQNEWVREDMSKRGKRLDIEILPHLTRLVAKGLATKAKETFIDGRNKSKWFVLFIELALFQFTSTRNLCYLLYICNISLHVILMIMIIYPVKMISSVIFIRICKKKLLFFTSTSVCIFFF